MTAVTVIVYAVAGCSAAVADLWHINTVFSVPNDTADRTAATTRNHYTNVHANYTAHKTVANKQRGACASRYFTIRNMLERATQTTKHDDGT